MTASEGARGAGTTALADAVRSLSGVSVPSAAGVDGEEDAETAGTMLRAVGSTVDVDGETTVSAVASVVATVSSMALDTVCVALETVCVALETVSVALETVPVAVSTVEFTTLPAWPVALVAESTVPVTVFVTSPTVEVAH